MWEADMSKFPSEPKEIAALLGKMIEMTKQSLKEGKVTEWGIFPGGGKGYAIIEGSAADVLTGATQFMPYVSFSAQEVLSIDDMAEVMKSMMP